MISKFQDRHKYKSNLFHRRKERFLYRRNKWRSTFYAPDAIKLPEVFGLNREHERDLLLKAVAHIHMRASECDKIWLDFRQTKKLFSEGMLYFYAEIDNLMNIEPRLSFSCIESRNDKVNHVLQQIGLFKLCHHRFNVKREYDDVIHWRSCYGIEVLTDRFDEVIDPEKVLSKIPLNMDIYGGCVEATKNAHYHAYIRQRDLSPVMNTKTAWWIFSQIKDGRISVAVCDLGIGIPKTLPQKNQTAFEEIKQYVIGTLNEMGFKFTQFTDAHLILGAIKTPTSRTNKGYRGNGLKKIADTAANDPTASFAIHSGKGYVGTTKGKLKFFNYGSVFPGTMVAWSLPLGDKDVRR